MLWMPWANEVPNGSSIRERLMPDNKGGTRSIRADSHAAGTRSELLTYKILYR